LSTKTDDGPPKCRFHKGELILPTIALEWPAVRASPTWLVPRAWSGPELSCPWCHTQGHGLLGYCRWRPANDATCDQTPCPTCSHPQADHGVHGIVYCSNCRRGVRVPTADHKGVAFWNDDGPPNSQWAWRPMNDGQRRWLKENHPEWIDWMEEHRRRYEQTRVQAPPRGAGVLG
jgi:hypothetical protein